MNETYLKYNITESDKSDAHNNNDDNSEETLLLNSGYYVFE